MNSKKKRILFGVLVCLSLIGILYIILYNKGTKKYYNIENPATHLNIQVFDDQKFVLVSQKNSEGYIYFGQDYVTTFSEHSLFTGDLKTPPLIGEEEFFKVISYSLNHLGQKKEFDIYRLLGKDNTYRSFGKVPDSYGYYNGNDYLTLYLQKIDKDNYSDLKDSNNKRILFTAIKRSLSPSKARPIAAPTSFTFSCKCSG